MRRGAFLDRDGVLNERPPEHEYVTRPEELIILPGVAAAIGILRQHHFTPVVVSNQRGVGLGLLDEPVLRQIEAQLRAAGADVERFYYCRHSLDDHCPCRKPAPGLLLEAAHELDLDLSASVMIGDSETDVLAGRAAGCRTILIAPETTATSADATATDILAAATLAVRLAAPQTPADE